MPAITFTIDDNGVPAGVILFIGREWCGLACPKLPGTYGGPYAVTYFRTDEDLITIDYDQRIRDALESKRIIYTRVGDLTLTDEIAEQYVAFELARSVLYHEMELVTKFARYEAAGKMICDIQDKVESLEQQLSQIHNNESEGLTEDQFNRLKSAHSAIETVYTDLDYVVDPE